MNRTDAIADVTRRTDGQQASEMNVSAGIALAEMLRTTLGPNGRDKMLVSDGTVVLTNDGASIVDRMDIGSPAAKLVADVARAQSGELGDGSTSAIVLAGALLDEADSLLDDGGHPTTVVGGYHEAARRVHGSLDAVSLTSGGDGLLQNVVSTAITGRWDDERTAFLADLTARAYRAARGDDDAVRLENVTIHGVAGGGTTDSELIDGLVIDADASSTSLAEVPTPVPRRLHDARVAVLDDQLTIRSPDAVSRYSLDSADGLRRAREHEDEEYRRYVERLDTGDVDVLFCQKSVDDRLRTLLARAGILVFERTRQDEVHKLERATGARAVMRLDALDEEAVGHADGVERVDVGGGSFVIVRDASSSQVSVLLRAGTAHVVEETERIVTDAIALLETLDDHPGLVPGGGATEVALARDVREYSRAIGGREALAVEAFADALETIPVALARNAGLDPIGTLLELRHQHAAGDDRVGIEGDAGELADVVARGVVEPVRLKERVVANATDAATLVLRIDGIIETAGSVGDGDGDGHDHDHAHGGVRGDPGGYPWAIGH